MGNTLQRMTCRDTSDIDAGHEVVPPSESQGSTVDDGIGLNSNRASNNASPPRRSIALECPPITGNKNPLLSKGVDAQGRKQYQLGDQPLFKPYDTSIDKPADGHRQFYAQGRMNAIDKRLNPDASVFVKRGLHPRPDPSWLRAQGTLLNRIHASLAGPDAQAHRDHFAVEVLKSIEDGNRGVYLTPIVKGFSLEDYIDDPASYAGRFPVQDLDSMKRQLTDAMSWLSEKGFVHGDVKPANIMYDEDHRRLVLIDFELARPATAERLNRDLVDLDYAFDDIVS